MSFGGNKDEGLPQFKKFVSEDELEEKRKKRQEEWEKVRTPDQPLEAPEEEFDSRCLFDKLQEQKLKKQDEYESQFKLSNQVKGLDTEEAQFLDYVSGRQQELEKARQQEDYEVIRECRNAMVTKVAEKPSTSLVVNPAPAVSRPAAKETKKSQAALLAGAVKRKGSQAEAQDAKKSKDSNSDQAADSENSKAEPAAASSSEAAAAAATEASQTPQVGKVIGILPGMGEYSDSSDSETSSSDSDIDTDVFQGKNLIKIVSAQCGH